MRARAPDTDRALLRRAARRIGLQTAILVWAAFGLCAAVLLALVLHAQHLATAATLRSAVERADDVNDPPDATWLAVEAPSGGFAISPGSPALLPYRPSLVTTTPARATTVDVHTPQGEYRVLTERRNGRFVQAAGSLSAEHAERARLLEAVAVAGGLAVLIAGLLGTLAGRRWVSPLADALSRQRSFVADASHELRTPLTHLTTRAQLVERSMVRGDIDRARTEAAALVTDGRRLSAVLEDLLSAAEPTDSSAFSPVDLHAVAEAAVAAIRGEAEAADVTLELGPGDEPGAASRAPVVVRAPRAALDRAVLALLDNAVRHSPAGRSVSVAVGADRRWATMSVSDTGSGIPRAAQKHVFDRFAHGPAANPEGGSRRRFGLGLALVADTAQRLGGDVSFTTGPDGTTMTVRLPSAAARGGSALISF
jgi:two-component system OmpR family sensor kinase